MPRLSQWIPAAFLSLLLADAALAQTASEWVTIANEHYAARRFGASAEAYDQAIAAGAENPTTFYNAACSAALAGETDRAFENLEGALDRGWRDVTLLIRDSDLIGLHDGARWPAIVRRCEEAERLFVESLANPKLRDELLEMRSVDQAVRRGENIPELAEKNMGDVDAENTARMKEIIATHGWPNKSLVGEDGARSAWLLVQHADADPEFQRSCLELMKAEPEGEVSLVDLAYLTDRVLVNEDKKQLYGTQFWTVQGELVPRPIEDEAGVEARRSELGMISMKEYTARMTGRN